MRDISAKFPTLRTAVARAEVDVAVGTLARIRAQSVPKGDPLPVARVAGVQAAKMTSQLIPYCHPVPLSFVGVDFMMQDTTIVVTATAKAIYATGVEMEALTAASITALTLYDMLKPLDEGIAIRNVRLLEKHGGQSDYPAATEHPLQAGVLVISDSVSAGTHEDRSGGVIVARLQDAGVAVVECACVPDDAGCIRQALCRLADERHVALVITTGGTGCGPRDGTPEAVAPLFDREIPGVAEAIRAYGLARTPYAMLTRGKAGMHGGTLIVTLPGSLRAVTESLDLLLPVLLHAIATLQTDGWHSAVTPAMPEVGA